MMNMQMDRLNQETDTFPPLPADDQAVSSDAEIGLAETVSSPSHSIFSKIDWSIVWMVLSLKALVLVYGAAAYQVLTNKRIESWYGYLEIWHRWDSMRYFRVAEHGFTNVGPDRADLTGSPLFPWIVRAFSLVFRDTLMSGFIVAGIASVAAGLLLYHLARVDQRGSIAKNSVWFLLIFPTAHFLHINFTESLFLALVLGTFLAARKEHWKTAGFLGFLTCMTRINGLVLVPALFIEAYLQFRKTREWRWDWLSILVVPFGFGANLAVNKVVAGDPFAFMAINKQVYFKSLAPPWNGIRGLYDAMWGSDPANAMMSGVQELFFVALAFVCIFACWKWLSASYTVWMAGNWLLFTSTDFLQSEPRYVIILFPIFILFAKLAERPFWFRLITAWSVLFLALFIGQFVRGHWAY